MGHGAAKDEPAPRWAKGGNDRVIIYRCGPAGLGHTLVSILHAASFAATTNRKLALDMRCFAFFQEDAHDRFMELFDLQAPEGVEVETNLDRIDALYQNDRLVSLGQPDVMGRGLAPDPDVLLVIHNTIENIASPGEAHFRLTGPIGREVLRALGKFGLDDASEGRRQIGVHFRHGNGEFLNLRPDGLRFELHKSWLRRLNRSYRRAIAEAIRRQKEHSPLIYVAGDNAEFIRKMRRGFRRTVSLAEQLGNLPWHEQLLSSQSPQSLFRDALVDLWALSNAGGLICGASLFSDFATLNNPDRIPSQVQQIEGTDWSQPSETVSLDLALETTGINLLQSPNHPRRLRFHARNLEIAGDVAEAQRLYSKADFEESVLNNPHYEFRHADLLLRLGRQDLVLERVRAALESMPDVAAFHHALGMLLLNENPIDAIDGLEAAVRLAPERLKFRLDLVRALAGVGRTGEARRLAEESVAIEQTRQTTYRIVGSIYDEPHPGAAAVCLAELS